MLNQMKSHPPSKLKSKFKNLDKKQFQNSNLLKNLLMMMMRTVKIQIKLPSRRQDRNHSPQNNNLNKLKLLKLKLKNLILKKKTLMQRNKMMKLKRKNNNPSQSRNKKISNMKFMLEESVSKQLKMI